MREVEWRVARLSLLIRLINSPIGSWQQLALATMMQLNTPWYRDVLADLRLVLPTESLTTHEGWCGVFVAPRGHWSDEGKWMGAQAIQLPRDFAGRRH